MSRETRTLTRTEYWKQAQRSILILILTWFGATFGAIFFARELSDLTLFGWPFSFYMAGQGLTLLYLAIVAVYIKRMRSLDKNLRSGAANVK